MVLFEYLIYIIVISRKSGVSFQEVFRREMAVYLDFNSDAKPVITKEEASEEKSKSESAPGSNKSKVISMSRSKSRSMSPRRRRSKSKSVKTRSDSKNNSNKSPLPYGFIFSPSIERLQSTP